MTRLPKDMVVFPRYLVGQALLSCMLILAIWYLRRNKLSYAAGAEPGNMEDQQNSSRALAYDSGGLRFCIETWQRPELRCNGVF